MIRLLPLLALAAVTRPGLGADCTGLSAANCHTFVLVPDGQMLVQGGIGSAQQLVYASIFSTIIADRGNWNIQAVLGLGDMVNTPYCNTWNLNNPGNPSGCTADYDSSEDIISSYTNGTVWSGYIQLDHAVPPIPYLVIPGNHDLSPLSTQGAPYSVPDRNYSESWKDTPAVSGHKVPNPGKYSGKYLTSRGYSWYTSLANQFYPPGVNRNSWFKLAVGGVNWLLMGSGFAEPHDSTNGNAMAWLANVAASNPDSNILFVTHSMAFGNLGGAAGSHHTAALMDYACPAYCNSIYGLDSTNSTSGIEIMNLVGKVSRNMIGMFSGHEYTNFGNDDHWSTSTRIANDGHTIVYGHFDYQDIDGWQGFSPTAESGYVVYVTIRNQNALEIRIKSANTGHAVDATHILPQAGNSFAPVKTYPVSLVSYGVTVSGRVSKTGNAVVR